jgi:hypothetical protein
MVAVRVTEPPKVLPEVVTAVVVLAWLTVSAMVLVTGL